MMKKLQKIVFFGTDDFSLITLQSLIDNGFNVAMVITKPDQKSGRGQKMTSPSVKILASQHNIPVLQPTKVSDINSEIEKLGNNLVGVLSSYGKIIAQSTINLFKPGIINIHPSLLPKYRGPSPIESSIKSLDSKTGVSIMLLTAGMDDGPVYSQVVHELNGSETGPELYDRLGRLGSELLVKILPQIIDGSIKPKPQDDQSATYSSLIKKEEAWIDFSNITSEQAGAIVRAHLGYPKTRTIINGTEIIIKKASISSKKDSPLDIECKDNNFLSIKELVVAKNGKQMSTNDFINGYLK